MKTQLNIMKKQLLTVVLTIAALLTNIGINAQTAEDWEKLEADINIYMANDLGRNGYYDQKTIAELMGNMAETVGPECVVAAGDVHHFNGVQSTSDPLWMTNYELIYTHPELMLDWFPILGNHEYCGNTQAVIDYSNVSRRWMMSDRYYTRTFSHNGTTLRIVLIDTTPIIDKYHNNSTGYPDAAKQNVEKQLAWLDETLKNAKEDWVIVIGHHPVYAETSKDNSERTDMQSKVLPILKKYGNVDIYACGHIHNFQHIRKDGDNIDYVVNSSASLSRKVKEIEGTVFCSPEPGFSIFGANKNELNMYMIDKTGTVLHTITRSK